MPLVNPLDTTQRTVPGLLAEDVGFLVRDSAGFLVCDSAGFPVVKPADAVEQGRYARVHRELDTLRSRVEDAHVVLDKLGHMPKADAPRTDETLLARVETTANEVKRLRYENEARAEALKNQKARVTKAIDMLAARLGHKGDIDALVAEFLQANVRPLKVGQVATLDELRAEGPAYMCTASGDIGSGHTLAEIWDRPAHLPGAKRLTDRELYDRYIRPAGSIGAIPKTRLPGMVLVSTEGPAYMCTASGDIGSGHTLAEIWDRPAHLPGAKLIYRKDQNVVSNYAKECAK